MRWLGLAFVVAVAAFFHGARLVTTQIVFNGDATSYIRPAEELLRTHEFRGMNPIANSLYQPGLNNRGGPETVRTPGYPLFLAAILFLGLPLQTAIWIQHLLAVALAAAVYLFTDLVLRQRMAGVIAGLLIATQPAMILIAHAYMSDILGVVFATAAMFFVLRGRPIAAGLLTGVATLIRPIAIFWFIPLAVVVAMRSRRRAAVVFVAASLVFPAAWMARNYAVTGVPTLASIDGENMLFFRAGAVLVLKERPLTFRLSALQQPSGLHREVDRLKPPLAAIAWAEARRDGVDPQRAPHAQLARYYWRVGQRIVLQHIPETLELAFSGLVEVFLYTWADQAAFWISTGSLLLMLTIVVAAAIFAAAILGIVLLYRRDRALALLFAATIVYFALMPAGGEGNVRFAIMFAPAYAIAAGVGIEHALARRDGSSGPS